jgi:hypothetical protein
MKQQIRNIPIHRISVGSDLFEADYHKAILMIKSVKKHGLIEPLSVNLQSGSYHLVLGKIRYIAAALAGKKVVPVMIIDSGNPGQTSNHLDIESYVSCKLKLLKSRSIKHGLRNSINLLIKRYLRKFHMA